MPKREVPRTQRWHVRQMEGVVFFGTPDDPSTSPVLVVPEAAVRGCLHTEAFSPVNGLECCTDCGSWRWNMTRWQRPRILRVGRASK